MNNVWMHYGTPGEYDRPICVVLMMPAVTMITVATHYHITQQLQ